MDQKYWVELSYFEHLYQHLSLCWPDLSSWVPWKETPITASCWTSALERKAVGSLSWPWRYWKIPDDSKLRFCFIEESFVFHQENLIKSYASKFSNTAVIILSNLFWRHGQEGKTYPGLLATRFLWPRTGGEGLQSPKSAGVVVGILHKRCPSVCFSWQPGTLLIQDQGCLSEMPQRQTISQLIFSGFSRLEKWKGTPRSLKGELRVCPCLLGAFQLLGRFFLASLEWVWRAAPPLISTSGSMRIHLPIHAATGKTNTLLLLFTVLVKEKQVPFPQD